MSPSNVAEGTMAFHFTEPLGFNFKAGQAADLRLLNPGAGIDEDDIRIEEFAGY